jgi:hypothetical protein
MTEPTYATWIGADGVAPVSGERDSRYYEIAQADPRLGGGPRWLTVTDHDRKPDGDDPGTGTWHLGWRALATHGQRDATHEAIYFVGMDFAPGSDIEQQREFDEFYTQVHVPEVVAAGGYSSGTRYALHRQLRYPAPKAPGLCAVYEADAAATARKLTTLGSTAAARPSYNSGPSAWTGRVTAWRLLYRRIRL